MQKLDSKINVYQLVLRTLISFIFYGGFIVLLTLQGDDAETEVLLLVAKIVAGVIIFFFAIWNFVLPLFIYKINGYQVNDDHLLNVKGVLFQRTDLIPIKRIQHIEKIQGPLQMVFKIATLRIFTAGSADMIIGLPEDVCEDLLMDIKKKVDPFLASGEGFEDEDK